MDYKDCYYVGWSADLTGYLMLDELIQLAAFCKEGLYKQYVMPHRDVSYASQRRHLLGTTTATFSKNNRSFKIRVLKDLATRESVKTKTEVFALLDFLSFLETISKKEGKPIVLVTFEEQKSESFSVLLLLQSLNRHLMLDRFKDVVKGFVNCRDYVQEKCNNTVVPFSLPSLATILLNKENPRQHSASNRAEYIYEILIHLSTGDSSDPIKDVAANLSSAVVSVDDNVKELQRTLQMIRCQQSLRPLFVPLFRFEDKRNHGIELRKLLMSAGLFLSDLKQMSENKDEFAEALKKRLPRSTKEEDIDELVKLTETYYSASEDELLDRPPVVTIRRGGRAPFAKKPAGPRAVRRRRSTRGKGAAGEATSTTLPSSTSEGKDTISTHTPSDSASNKTQTDSISSAKAESDTGSAKAESDTASAKTETDPRESDSSSVVTLSDLSSATTTLSETSFAAMTVSDSTPAKTQKRSPAKKSENNSNGVDGISPNKAG